MLSYCMLMSGLSDFQLDPRGHSQGFYNVVCQRMFLFCKRLWLDHILFHDFKIGHLREILIHGLPKFMDFSPSNKSYI